MRTQTVTMPQTLFMMNSLVVERAAMWFAVRIRLKCSDDLPAAIELAYCTV